MALPATDAFSAGADASLESYSANWTKGSGTGSCQVVASGGYCYPANSAYYYWNADTFDDNQYAQAVASGSTLGSATVQGIGVGVRVDTSGNGYFFQWGGYSPDSTNGGHLIRITGAPGSTTRTKLGATFTVPTAGQVCRLEVNGTTLEVFYDGVSQGTRSDSTHTSGKAGIITNGTVTTVRLDDWQAGNLAGGGVPIAAISGFYQRLRNN